MLRRLIVIQVLLVLTAPVRTVLPQEKSDSADSIEQLDARILDLQQQIIELQKRHEAEIAELKEQINELAAAAKEREEKEGIAALREAARANLAEPTPSEEQPEEKTFESGALSLQALNPEISVTGDFVFSSGQDSTTEKSSDFSFRTLGIHLESWLDPYTRFKAAIPVTENDAKLGEGYITLYNIADDLNLTLGKFRQQFGVVNRWHKHALDQVDFPLPLTRIFGEGGLNQSGISLDWMMPPAGKASRQLTFQVTDGENPRLFGENKSNRPSLLLHYKNFRDLSKDTYLEYGLSGLLGWNDEWSLLDGSKRDSREMTAVLGADLSMLWEPTEKMRYSNAEWRSEAYLLSKKLIAPDGSGSDKLNAWGGYTYLQRKISRKVDVGIRGDFFVPDSKSYANIPGYSFFPLAVTEKNPYVWQVSPYVTLHQSPHVKFRLQYRHADGKGIGGSSDAVFLQGVFSLGSHKHERY